MSLGSNSAMEVPPPRHLVGKPLSALPTPSLIIDRSVFADNCAHMHAIAAEQSLLFRAHVKSHKTAEGTKLQLGERLKKGEGKLVVSTIAEGWGLVQDGVLDDGTVGHVLFSLPPCPPTITRLIPLHKAMAGKGSVLQVMIDHPAQIEALDRMTKADGLEWSAFVKVDSGNHRAGLTPESSDFRKLIEAFSKSETVSIFGFYCHAGHSYASTSSDQASSYLYSEVATVNSASLIARQILSSSSSTRSYENSTFVLSVGSTPTANAAGTAEGKSKLDGLVRKTEKRAGWVDGGRLELHAGNYPLHDLQQLHTGLITPSRIAAHVLSCVCSVYPGRGNGGEAVCDAGGLAMSKDTGPEPGWGRVVTESLEGWSIGRLSQEHGILTHPHSPSPPSRLPSYGEKIKIIPQHACLTLAAYPYYFVVDGSQESEGTKWEDFVVREVWTAWKFW